MDVTADVDPDQERKERFPPSAHRSVTKDVLPRAFRFTLLAPNDADHNTIHFTTWVEVKVVNDRDKPLANERCILWTAEGKKREAKTNKLGIVRFDNLPCLDLQASTDDLTRPAFQLPDILEEWPDATIGNFPKTDDYQRQDRMIRFVPVETRKFEVKVNHLTEEQKFQHFCHQYVDHKARYWLSDPRNFDNGAKRWKWGHGAVCNQHVNFFLGYWFNYNQDFTTAGSATFTTCLPNYDSSKDHKFKIGSDTTKHRGYREFLDEVPGGTPLSFDPLPEPEKVSKIYRSVYWIRISKFFDKDTLEPKGDEGKAFFDSLSNFNMYALSDIQGTDRTTPAARKWLNKHKKQTKFTDKQLNKMTDSAIWELLFDKDEHDKVYGELMKWVDKFMDWKIKHWLRKHEDENNYTDSQVAALTDKQLWDIVWDLDDSKASDLELIKTLQDYVNWDHHGGLLLKRAADGGPPTGSGDVLWTFSADGSKSSSSGPLIVLKTFAEKDLKRKFLHLTIWSMKSLRPGGYAPEEAEDNAGSISVDAPSRFLFWV